MMETNQHNNLSGEKRKTLLVTIERRYQFLIVLGLFLPFVWEKILDASGAYSEKIIGDQIISVGMIVTMVFLAYLIFEIFKKVLRTGFLESLALCALGLSYVLMIIISFLEVHRNGQIGGSEAFMFKGAVWVMIGLLYYLVCVPIVALIVEGFIWLKKHRGGYVAEIKRIFNFN